MRFVLILLFVFSQIVYAKKIKYRKTQEVNFDEQSIDGVARKPTGSFLVQKRGINFLPLYKVDDQFDENIQESLEYLRE